MEAAAGDRIAVATAAPDERRVRRDGQFRVIDASHLVRGDLVVLRPRDRISADLTLTRSHAARWMSPWSAARALQSSTRPESR